METVGVFVILALLVGFLGRNRLLGFWGFFITSFLVSPVILVIALVLTVTRRTRRTRSTT
jgi:hypothetical protein